ncbi:MAG: hypothetical protein A4E49_00448 [Methanosaeta sp. PtaU1.Bin112]|nr:MAG: hypothetical protein A4E49_00448 [Methanosaeta sp. PtaU1.Bin112]
MIERSQEWLVLEYLPTSLFSLKISTASNKGGKTLFVPTPYSIKLAFIDAAFRIGGEELAKDIFNSIKRCDIRFSPSDRLYVLNTFIKILDESREETSDPYQSTIAYREFCYFQGMLEIALSLENCSSGIQEKLTEIAAHINYFGKRGGFFQYIKSRTISDLPLGFTVKATDIKGNIHDYEVVQPLDDLGELNSKDLFDRINTFSDKKIERGKHRIFVLTYLPYKMEKSSTNYTAYVNPYRCKECHSPTPP